MTEFFFETGFIKDDAHTLKELVYDTIDQSKLYLEFLKNFVPDAQFVKITFYGLDEDFIEETRSNVIKWRITFEEAKTNTIEFRGYYRSVIYDLVDRKTKETIFHGDWTAISDYVNSYRFEDYSQTELEAAYTTESYIVDRIEKAVGQIPNFDVLFNYEVSEEDYNFHKKNKENKN